MKEVGALDRIGLITKRGKDWLRRTLRRLSSTDGAK